MTKLPRETLENGYGEVTSLINDLPSVLSDLINDYVPTFVAVTLTGEEIYCRDAGDIDVTQVKAIHVFPGKVLHLPDK